MWFSITYPRFKNTVTFYNVILYFNVCSFFYPLTILTICDQKQTCEKLLDSFSVLDTDLKSDNVCDFSCNKTPSECDTDNVTHDEEDDETPMEGIAKVAVPGPTKVVVEEYVNDNKHQFIIKFVLFNTIG